MNQSANNTAFLGKSLDELSNLIAQQTEEIFIKEGIQIPVKSSSLMKALEQSGSATAADLAKQLNQSHQLIKQKLPKLHTLNLVEIHEDEFDKRRKVYVPTKEGLAQVKRLDTVLLKVTAAYERLYQDSGINLKEAIDSFSRTLERSSLLSLYTKEG